MKTIVLPGLLHISLSVKTLSTSEKENKEKRIQFYVVCECKESILFVALHPI